MKIESLKKSELLRIFAPLAHLSHKGEEHALFVHCHGELAVVVAGAVSSGSYRTGYPSDFDAPIAVDPAELAAAVIKAARAMRRGDTAELKVSPGGVRVAGQKLKAFAGVREVFIPSGSSLQTLPEKASPKGVRRTVQAVGVLGGAPAFFAAEGGYHVQARRPGAESPYYCGWIKEGRFSGPPVPGERGKASTPEPDNAQPTIVLVVEEKGQVTVIGPFRLAFKRRAEQLGGRWTGNVWTFKAGDYPKVIVAVREHFAAPVEYLAVGAAVAPPVEGTGKVAGFVGDVTPIIMAGRSCASSTAARYRLVEVSELVPSHDAQSFTVRRDYPAGVQERRYHTDKTEQQKVIDNSAPGCFEPALLANTDPTALGGAPIVTPSGVVLGGNSRTMVLQRVYVRGGEAMARYRAYLAGHLHEFGLPAAGLERLKQPVVVRVVEPADEETATLRDLVRRYNEGLTQDLERTAEQVAVSARLTDAAFAELQNIEDETFAAFLASPSSKGFVRVLLQTEVIPKARQGRMIGSGGLLSAEGRDFVTRALLGAILPDPALIDLLTDGLRDSLARSAAFVVNAAGVQPNATARAQWAIAPRLPEAVRLYSRARAASLRDVAELAGQVELTNEGLDPLDTANVLLANALLLRGGSRQLPDGFRRYAEASFQASTPSLLGNDERPVEALARAFKLAVPTGVPLAVTFAAAPTPTPLHPPAPTQTPTPTPAPTPAPASAPAKWPWSDVAVRESSYHGPFNPTVNAAIKRLGARWDSRVKAWVFDPRVRGEVVEAVRAEFGHHGEPVPLGDAEAELLAAHGVEFGDASVWFAGRELARRFERDSEVRTAPHVSVLKGRFADRGGSRKTPELKPTDGMVLRVRDVPISWLERNGYSLQPDGFWRWTPAAPPTPPPAPPTPPATPPTLPASARVYGLTAAGAVVPITTSAPADLERLGVVEVYAADRGLWREAPTRGDLGKIAPLGRLVDGAWVWTTYDPWIGHAPQGTRGAGFWALSSSGAPEDARKTPPAQAIAERDRQGPAEATVWWVPTEVYTGIGDFRNNRGQWLSPVRVIREAAPVLGAAYQYRRKQQ